MTNTPSMLREMARQMTALGVRPEIEAFDTGICGSPSNWRKRG